MAFTEIYVGPTGSVVNDGSSEANAMDFTNAILSMDSLPSIRLNIKVGTYTGLNRQAILTGGANTTPIAWRGYRTTPGDGYLGRDSSGNLITTNMPLLIYTSGQLTDVQANDLGFGQIENIYFQVSKSGSVTAPITAAASTSLINCKIENMSVGTGNLTAQLSSNSNMINCDISVPNAGSGAVALRMVGGRAIGCKMSTLYGSGVAVRISGTVGGALVSDCVLFNNLIGIELVHTTGNITPSIVNNTIYNCSGAAIQTPSTVYNTNTTIVNNHITDNGRFLNQQTLVNNCIVGNRTRDNTNTNTNQGDYGIFLAVTGDSGTVTSDFTKTDNSFILKDNAYGRRTSFLQNRDIGGKQGYDSYGFAG